MSFLNAVTPWSATVQEDLQNSGILFELERSGYRYQIQNTGNSIWCVVRWPAGGSIAFRLAYGMNGIFDDPEITEENDGLLIKAATRLATYRINLTFPDSQRTVFRFTTTFNVRFSMLIPFWPRDIVPITEDGRVENTAGKIHALQEGGRSGQLFFSYTKPKTGSVFYFQNLSAMSPYCEMSETILTNSVGGSWPEIGFQFPVNKDKPIPANKDYVINDAFVFLSEELPEQDYDICQQYLDFLSAVYLMLPKPEIKYTDWINIAESALENLDHNKGCWRLVDGSPYLTAYLGDYKTPSEIMVQLAVLLPLREYLDWKGEEHRIYAELRDGLNIFYDDHLKTIVRWHPSLNDELDNSEEQKQVMVMDSWYLHHPLLNLARLALNGDKNAEKLFLDSIEYAMRVAHHFKYEWPVFYRMTTLEILKAETGPGKGGEKDVPGSYAHIMLMAWKITGEKRYLAEAAKAVKLLGGLAFDIFYQANNTAFTAAALVEMYKESNDDYYLKLSYCCLAGVFRNVHIWDCGYGYGKHFPSFFAVYPLKDAPYTAAYEELEVYAALSYYMEVADGIDILPSLKILIPEFIRYAVNRMAYYFPAMLPKEMIVSQDEVKTGEIQQDLWIPLEDINDGWEKCGAVGQEVYGAGIGFGVVPRQYFKVKGGKMILFTDYPTTGFRNGKNGISFRTLGDSSMPCSVRFIGASKKELSKMKVEVKSASSYKEAERGKDENEFIVRGGSNIRISFG